MSQGDSLENAPEKGTSFKRAAPRAAADTETGDSPPDVLAAAWPALPPHVRRCILAIAAAGDALSEAQAAEIARSLDGGAGE